MLDILKSFLQRLRKRKMNYMDLYALS
ncbi:protein of unknown function [Methylorubrum extorquens]|uniref:Uncharacterized protein n=1 Tax=Methylorubrum extorquens TaxID=408 RepID=A0A2N9AJ15_METEX|nr:protein of unknown function [Methylorubrum extorquens]